MTIQVGISASIIAVSSVSLSYRVLFSRTRHGLNHAECRPARYDVTALFQKLDSAGYRLSIHSASYCCPKSQVVCGFLLFVRVARFG